MLSAYPCHGLSEKEIQKTLENLTKNIKDFKPLRLEFNFVKEFPKKPAMIFVGSMSEIAHWPSGWMQHVLHKIRRYPQHTFMFLTKDPSVYNRYKFPLNCLLGWTITNSRDFSNGLNLEANTFYCRNKDNIVFASFEPLHGEIHENIVSKFNWLKYIDQVCCYYDIPIYMKDNLLEPFPLLKLKQEWPDFTFPSGASIRFKPNEAQKHYMDKFVGADDSIFNDPILRKMYLEGNWDVETPKDKDGK